MGKNKLSLLAMSSILATDVIYKSGLSEIDALKLKCFLLLLKKEGFSLLDLMEFAKQGKKSDEVLNHLLSFFKEYIAATANSCRKLYLKSFINSISNISKEEIVEAFELVLENYYRNKSNASIDSMQSIGLTKLMAHFIPGGKDLSVYNPFAGLASFKLELRNRGSYIGQELNEDLWTLGYMRLMVNSSLENSQYQNINSLEYLCKVVPEKFDCVIFNPPLQISDGIPLEFKDKAANIRGQNIYSQLVISESFKLLNKNGKLICLSTNALLDIRQRHVQSFRKNLVINGYVEKVILLPTGTLMSTSVATSIVVLSKQMNRNVLFLDASEYFDNDSGRNIKLQYQEIIELIEVGDNYSNMRYISKEEIVKNDYSLSVKRYVVEDLELDETQISQMRYLGDILKVINSKKQNITSKAKVVQLNDLPKSDLVFSKDFTTLKPSLKNKRGATLAPNSLLLSTVNKNLLATYYSGTNSSLYYNPTTLLNCEIYENEILPEYLILELRKSYVKKQLSKFVVGTYVMRITNNDLMKIKIVVPSIFEQQQIVYEYKSEKHLAEQDKVRELALEYGINIADENSFLRHQISGRFKNIRGAFRSLKSILNEQIINEVPNLHQYKRDQKLESTFGTYLAIIERDLRSIGDTLNKTGAEIDLADAKIETIDLREFITNYLNELKNRENNIFSIQLIDDPLYLKVNDINKIFIRGDRNLLSKAFDNIISNAEKHAFENKISHNNKIEVQMLYSANPDEIQIDFANTGLPMPEELTYERFIRKGDALGNNAGDGTGIPFVYEVMKLHNGSLGYTDEKGGEGFSSNLVTSIELTLPIEIKFTKDV